MSGYVRYSKGPELLIDMVDQVTDVLSTTGRLAPEDAEALAVAITNKMANNWGGQFVYFPKGIWNGGDLTCFQLEERDIKIYEEYNGTNRAEVCLKYNISHRRLYQVISAVRQSRRNNRTPAQTGD